MINVHRCKCAHLHWCNVCVRSKRFSIKPGARRRRRSRLLCLCPARKQPEDNPITVARRPPPPYWWIVYIIESRLYVCRRHTHTHVYTSTRTHPTHNIQDIRVRTHAYIHDTYAYTLAYTHTHIQRRRYDHPFPTRLFLRHFFFYTNLYHCTRFTNSDIARTCLPAVVNRGRQRLRGVISKFY